MGPNDRDVDSNGVDDLLEVRAQAATGGSVQPGPVFRARYDCPSGTSVPASAVTCMPAQAAGLDGLPFDPALAAQISCTLALATAP